MLQAFSHWSVAAPIGSCEAGSHLISAKREGKSGGGKWRGKWTRRVPTLTTNETQPNKRTYREKCSRGVLAVHWAVANDANNAATENQYSCMFVVVANPAILHLFWGMFPLQPYPSCAHFASAYRATRSEATTLHMHATWKLADGCQPRVGGR